MLSSDACELSGLDGFYGIGTRLCIYLVALSLWVSNFALRGQLKSSIASLNTILNVAILVGLFWTTSFPRQIQALDVFILLQLGLISSFVGLYEKSRSKFWEFNPLHALANHSALLTLCVFNLWFWWSGIRRYQFSDCMSSVFLFVRLDLYGIFRTFHKAMSIVALFFSIVSTINLFLRMWNFWSSPALMKQLQELEQTLFHEKTTALTSAVTPNTFFDDTASSCRKLKILPLSFPDLSAADAFVATAMADALPPLKSSRSRALSIVMSPKWGNSPKQLPSPSDSPNLSGSNKSNLSLLLPVWVYATTIGGLSPFAYLKCLRRAKKSVQHRRRLVIPGALHTYLAIREAALPPPRRARDIPRALITLLLIVGLITTIELAIRWNHVQHVGISDMDSIMQWLPALIGAGAMFEAIKAVIGEALGTGATTFKSDLTRQVEKCSEMYYEIKAQQEGEHITV